MTNPAFPNFSGCTVDIYEGTSNLIPRFMVDVIIYPTWYSSYTVLAKGDPSWYNLPEPDFQSSFVHHNDVIMNAIASQITSLMSVYWSVHSGADQRKHQSSASLAFVRGIHRWPVNSAHKGPVTRKMFPFDDVIMWHEQTDMVLI